MESLKKIKNTTVKKESPSLESIYEKTFPIVAKFISSVGGSFHDAKDIFHDAMVILLEKKSQEKVDFIQSEKAYLLGISKHLWIRKYTNNQKETSLSSLEGVIEVPEDFFPKPNEKRLLNFLKIAGEKCMRLLRAFYFQQLSIPEITKEFDFRNTHSASVQKHKCLEKVKKTIKEKSLSYDAFTTQY